MVNLSLSKHKKITALSKYLCLLIFTLCLSISSYTNFSAYINSQRILENHSLVDAALSFDGKNRHTTLFFYTTDNYQFNFQFTVNGKTYSQELITNEYTADDYFKSTSLEVAYFNQDPSRFGLLTTLQKDSNLFTILGRLWMLTFGMGFISIICHLFISRKVFTHQI